MKQKLITTAVIMAVVLAILIAIPVFVMSLFLGQRFYQPQYNPAAFGISSEITEHINLATGDGLTLAAWRTYSNTDTPHGTVIIISGLQMPSVTAFFGYANMLAMHGWDTLLIEKRARSLSEGEGIGFGITEWLDVKAGVDFLTADARVGELPIVTMGTSAGGATVLVAAGEIPRIDGVIAISAYSNFVDLYIDSMSMMGLPWFLGTITSPFMRLRMGLHFGFDAARYTPANGIVKLGQRPVLLMHSTEDWQVPFSHFNTLYRLAGENEINITTFVREGDWHFVCYDRYVSNPIHDVEFASAVLGWLRQFENI